MPAIKRMASGRRKVAKRSSQRATKTAEQNHKAVLRKIYRTFFSRPSEELARQLYDPEFQGHDPAYSGVIQGVSSILKLIEQQRGLLPEHEYRLIDVIAEGNKAAVRWGVKGTDQLGTPFTIEGISFCRFRKGKLAEAWAHWDNMGLAEQVHLNMKDLSC